MSDSGSAPSSTQDVLALIGVNGWIAGECYALSPGDDIVLGRSRSCDISLRRAKTYLAKSRYDRDNDHDFNTVSRRHLHLTVVDTSYIRLEDLSTNGTYVDEVLMSDALDVNARERLIQVRLGTRETIQVQYLSQSDFEAKRTELEGDDDDESGLRPHSDLPADADDPLAFNDDDDPDNAKTSET